MADFRRKERHPAALRITVAVLVCLAGCAVKRPLAALRSPSPLLWPAAHQGCRSAHHGNTEAALQCAVLHHAPLIEVDVRTSADGELLLFHDRRVEKLNVAPSLREKPFSELPASELLALCYPDAPSECIVSLERALEIVQDRDSLLLLDVKNANPNMLEKITALLKARRQEGQVIVQCQSFDALQFVRMHAPQLAVLARCHAPEEVEIALDFSPEIVQVDEIWFSDALRRKIRAAGSHTLIKAISHLDDEQGWCKLIGRGAEIILTDRIEDFTGGKAVLAERCLHTDEDALDSKLTF